jgi:hypothetical protein
MLSKERKGGDRRQDEFLDLPQVLLPVEVQMLSSGLHTSQLAISELMVTGGKYNFNLLTNK